jgi:hypothetical protein
MKILQFIIQTVILCRTKMVLLIIRLKQHTKFWENEDLQSLCLWIHTTRAFTPILKPLWNTVISKVDCKDPDLVQVTFYIMLWPREHEYVYFRIT